MEYLGFYINEQMKWTFKSHKGFFIPVIYNEHIKGLRIHLETEYKFDTTDIWFSSGNEYKGASAKNSLMIFVPKDYKKIKMYNIKSENQKEDIIIASEFIMAYKLFNKYNKLTIALPNRITKKQANLILEKINILSVDIYLDKHTILTDTTSLHQNLLELIDEEKKKVNFIFDYKDLINNKEEQIIKNVA